MDLGLDVHSVVHPTMPQSVNERRVEIKEFENPLSFRAFKKNLKVTKEHIVYYILLA